MQKKEKPANSKIANQSFEKNKPEYGGTLIRALSGEPVSLQPLYGYSDSASCEIIIHLFPPLVRKLEDPDNPGKPKLTPVLAESWEFLKMAKCCFSSCVKAFFGKTALKSRPMM